MIRKDYILNQIEMLARVTATLIFRDRDGGESLLIFSSSREAIEEELWDRLLALIQSGEIGPAEDLLYDAWDGKEGSLDLTLLNTALRFYGWLMGLSPEVLKEGNFSTEEIRDGWSGVQEMAGIVDILF